MTDDLVTRLRKEDPECGLRHSIAMEAADRIETLEKGFRDILGTKCELEHESMILIRIIAKACLVGAIDASGAYCFVPER